MVLSSFCFITIIIISSLSHCSAMHVENSSASFQFSYNDPNEQNEDGDTFLATVLKSDTELILEWIKFFLSCTTLDINIRNKQGFTALYGLLGEMQSPDQKCLECAQLIMQEPRFDIKKHQYAINRGFKNITEGWPAMDDVGIFFNPPLVEYILSFVDDEKLLADRIEDLEERFKGQTQGKYRQQLEKFLKKFEAQKNKLEVKP